MQDGTIAQYEQNLGLYMFDNNRYFMHGCNCSYAVYLKMFMISPYRTLCTHKILTSSKIYSPCTWPHRFDFRLHLLRKQIKLGSNGQRTRPTSTLEEQTLQPTCMYIWSLPIPIHTITLKFNILNGRSLYINSVYIYMSCMLVFYAVTYIRLLFAVYVDGSCFVDFLSALPPLRSTI